MHIQWYMYITYYNICLQVLFVLYMYLYTIIVNYICGILKIIFSCIHVYACIYSYTYYIFIRLDGLHDIRLFEHVQRLHRAQAEFSLKHK